jgi:hypothetical protein
VDRLHVARILGLDPLAADVVEVILTGGEPDALSRERLKKPAPIRWDEQRKAFGSRKSLSRER